MFNKLCVVLVSVILGAWIVSSQLIGNDSRAKAPAKNNRCLNPSAFPTARLNPEVICQGKDVYCAFPGKTCGKSGQEGRCNKKPEVCSKNCPGVCGCDGQRYCNECLAATAGVDVSSSKACLRNPPVRPAGQTCGGFAGIACPSGYFCDAPCYGADMTGVCQVIPQVCTKEYNPVCGCDGMTYSNLCEAHSKGVTVKSGGPCAPVLPAGRICGGFAGFSCSVDEFCDFQGTCGVADQSGICRARPQACTFDYRPVCGCDGNTYGNRCGAESAGVSVSYEGECKSKPVEPAGIMCGGLLGLACPADQYCNLEGTCGAADQTGVCTVKPQACTFEYSPVCGCDGITYGSKCAAASAGVSVIHGGECARASESSARRCGGLMGAPCGAGEYCDFGPTCGAADEMGTCKPQTQFCTFEYRPVCGCDLKTYGNPCAAAAAGMSVIYEGECKKQ